MKSHLNIKTGLLNLFLIFVNTFFIISPAMAQATFLIWPIYPKIEFNEKATAVWLQNTGKSDAMVQIRVFKWNQNNYSDDYSDQSEIIPSPPITKIKAGEKHMLRLSKTGNIPEGQEYAYRIIVDELPIQLNQDGDNTSSKVNFQMRYSIPLFVYGKGVGSGLTEETQKMNAKNISAKPVLTWSIQKNAQGNTELFLKNSGQKFARLSAIKLTQNASEIALGKVAFGYILAKSTMKFEIDSDTANRLMNSTVIYGIDRSGVKKELIDIVKQGE